MLADLQTRAEQQNNWLKRLAVYLALAASKLMVNLLFAQQQTTSEKENAAIAVETDEDALTRRDPVYPTRELDWATLLVPYLLANHDGDYLVVPNTTRCAKMLMAARALEYQGAAVLLNLNVPWTCVATYRPAANQFERLLPDARNLNYAIYKLTPPFAQAMRLQILQPASAVQPICAQPQYSVATA